MIFSPVERMIALRYLRARRQEGFISVIAWFSLIGILLGVATLIIVPAVFNGFRAELMGRILGLNGHITIYAPADRPFRAFEPMLAKLRAIPGVASATPLIEGQVMASGAHTAAGAMVRGLRTEDLKARKLISDKMVAGSLDGLDADSIVIGTRMGGKFGIRLGESITLISPRGNTTAFGTVPRSKAFKVVGIFELGMAEYDSSFVFMGWSDASNFFRAEDGAHAIEIMLTDAERAPEIAGTLSVDRGIPGRVYDWQQANAHFFNAVQTERNVTTLVLTLIIIVAAFNIVSSMIMMVKDKGRGIAILRTMGASRGMILRIFLMTGASVGIFGTLAGFVIGVLFCENIDNIKRFIEGLTDAILFAPEIYYLTRLPAKMEWGQVLQVLGLGCTLSVVASLYPAWRAARLDPVEALRYE